MVNWSSIIDCNDDLSVFDDIAEIKQLSKTPVDLHIISSEPEKYFTKIVEHNVDYVTFQYENLKGKLSLPQDIQSKLGLAITTNTDISAFDEYAEDFDFILFMTTIPGQSGGVFDKSNFKKIREFRQRFPDKNIHVDYSQQTWLLPCVPAWLIVRLVQLIPSSSSLAWSPCAVAVRVKEVAVLTMV